MAATAALGSVEKVITAEANLRDAALSLAHGEKLTHLLSELQDVAEALSQCRGPESVEAAAPSAPVAMEGMRPALPNWWFLLSEMLQACEREIEFVASIGHGQRRHGLSRDLCNLVVRVLRKHYQGLLVEAEAWMDTADG